MDNVKRAQELLDKLQREHGIDPTEVTEAASAYLVTLGLSVFDPGNKLVEKRLESAGGTKELAALLDEAYEKGGKALERRGLAMQLTWAVRELVTNVIVRAVLKGQ